MKSDKKRVSIDKVNWSIGFSNLETKIKITLNERNGH